MTQVQFLLSGFKKHSVAKRAKGPSRAISKECGTVPHSSGSLWLTRTHKRETTTQEQSAT
jgi:hypothetical protein